ncbi:T9SS type A sorting domain-containing protein [Neolewinella agarilytica]|uniref:T9SS type A sorting domain-containing protein n=1 Tax=Neolewinella agarilytica TaxID=478744 RepID=UPI002355E99D|nr:T9SS type A sorting domain-containing protein [Neolewinella agarilytica]
MHKTILFFSFLFFAVGLSATDYYVAKSGSDTNDGSEGSPFLTISKAASLMVAGDVCYIRQGTYREVLRPANGGTAAAPITFRAFGEDKVTISATEPIESWTLDEGTSYKASADIELDRQTMLYYNGEPMDYARWPNNEDGNPYTIDAMTVDNGTASTIIATELPANVDLSGGYVWYLGAHSGASWTQPISSVSGKTIHHAANDITRWPFNPHNPTVFRNGNRGRFYVFGAKDLLDFPKEWYFDAAADEVFFSPPGGDTPNATTEYAARTHTILTDKPWTVIEGIGTFGGMVEINGDHTTLRNCDIRYGFQVLDEIGNTNAQVSEGSVWVRASNVLVEDNFIEGGSHNGVSVQGWGGVSDVSIIANEIREFNTVGNHSSPIRCRSPRSKLISNTLVGSGRDGIFIPSNDCEVAWNDVSDVMRINNDGGLFYVVGNDSDKNTSIHHNWFHDSFGPDYADGRCAGIYLDNDSKGYDVHHNVVWNISWSAVQMNWDAWNNDIFNNTFWNVQQAMGIWLNGRIQKDNRIWNNYTPIGPWEGQDVADNVISASNPFLDLAALDFRPADDSPLINAGRIIPGITDGYRGAAPEVGAYEANQPGWIPGAPRAGGGGTTSLFNSHGTRVRARVFPNPATDRAFVNFETTESGLLNWRLIAADGRSVRSSQRTLAAGEQSIMLNLRGLPAGTYFFSATLRDAYIGQAIIVR